tara:strand:- start:187679 stop:188872 length:1194 start_codon:yes stop_codon:yes gene_type:complete
MMRVKVSLIALFFSLSVTEFTKADDEAVSLRLLVQTLDETESDAIRASLMRGMLDGLAGRRNVHPPSRWADVAMKLGTSDDHIVRKYAMQLSHVFGDRSAILRAIKTVQDPSADPEVRRTALNALLTAKNDQLDSLLPQLLDDKVLGIDAIRGFAVTGNPDASDLLVRRYREMDTGSKKAAIETLASREIYAHALLNAIHSGVVSRDDIPAHVARSMESLLGDAFVKTFGRIRPLQPDREKLIAKYKRILTPETLAAADARHGRTVFQKTCANCHLLYGEGGDIGPDLTGSNRANLDYLLLNSVDPSYDVPDSYRMVLIQTVDGRLLSGVVAEEDSRKVILKTVQQPRMTVLQQDIEARKRSPKSMMPDGQLEQLKRDELVDLVKYLQTKEQVELPE